MLGAAPGVKTPSLHSNEMSLGQFEQRVAKVFVREGYGYEGLVALSADSVEDAHTRLIAGEQSFSQAVGLLLKGYRDLCEE